MLNARHVVDGGAVQITARQQFLIKLYNFSACASLGTKLIKLCFRSVDPYNLSGLGQFYRFVYETQYLLIICHYFNLPAPFGAQ
jgi:hypothetical protein